jgi:CcmD family protein
MKPSPLRVSFRARGWILGAWLLTAGAAVAAEPVHAQDAAEERAQSFQAVEGAVKEDVPGGPLLVAAYGAIWVLLLLYVIRLVRMQQRAQSDLQRLEQALARSPQRDAAG